MKKTKQKDWIASNILILGIILLIIIFIIEPKGLKINSNVFIGSLTALLGLLGITIHIKSTKAMEAERRLHELNLNHHNALAQIGMRSYDVRKEIYQQFLRPFMEALILQKRGEVPDFQEQMESMVLRELFTREVFSLLVHKQLINLTLVQKILHWRHTGFHVHSKVRATSKHEAERVGKYMIRPILSLKWLSFDEAQGQASKITKLSTRLSLTSSLPSWPDGLLPLKLSSRNS